MFNGWLSFAGTEVINSTRTQAYIEHIGYNWFKPCFDCEDLQLGLGDPPYTSPLRDEAPWIDANDPDTFNFYGVYPIDITGVDDSTVTASAVEGTRAGGIVTVRKANTRTMVFSAMLIGADACAAAAGMRWLRAVLDGSPCGGGTGCNGDDLCFLSCCPPICNDVEDPSACTTDYVRTFRKVTTIAGPTIIAHNTLSDGAEIIQVEWTMVAAVPYAYAQGDHVQTIIVSDDPGDFDPIIDMDEVSCTPSPDPAPIYDPFCVVPLTPPLLPLVPLDCFEIPESWDRYTMRVPYTKVPAWDTAVPRITLEAGEDDLHTIRVRFYPDPLGNLTPPDLDACSFCGEFLVTYLPALHEIDIDGMTETITARQITSDMSVNVGHLVTASDESGFTWPELACGVGYLMTIDVPTGTESLATIDLTLFTRAAA